jgi:hypothetical protein
MLFTVQAFLEDYFRNHGLSDPDGYAVKAANLFFFQRDAYRSVKDFHKRMHRIQTVFYLTNHINNRSLFENQLVTKLESKFAKNSKSDLKKIIDTVISRSPKNKRRTIDQLLSDFKSVVEASAVDSFWKSRKKNILKDKPEKIAQGLLASCIRMTLGGKGIVLRELYSGIGFVDVGVIISNTLHLIEVKILTKGFLGVEQLEKYMKTEKRKTGSLVVIDAMPPDKKVEIPRKVSRKGGKIRVVVVDINPPSPSSLNVIRY